MEMMKDEDEGAEQKGRELQAVTELPEEEECDNTARFGRCLKQQQNPSRNCKQMYYSFQEAIHQQGRIELNRHIKCTSIKIPAKELQDDELIPQETNRSVKIKNARGVLRSGHNMCGSHKSKSKNYYEKFLTPSKEQKRDTSTVLNFIDHQRNSTGEVNYIFDSGEELVFPVARPTQFRNSDSILQQRWKFSQSLILPHTSDDPAIDSEEQEEAKDDFRASTGSVNDLFNIFAIEKSGSTQKERVNNL